MLLSEGREVPAKLPAVSKEASWGGVESLLRGVAKKNGTETAGHQWVRLRLLTCMNQSLMGWVDDDDDDDDAKNEMTKGGGPRQRRLLRRLLLP